METTEPLPKNIDIKEWQMIKNFKLSFIRTPRLQVNNLEELQQFKTPTICCIRASLAKQAIKSKLVDVLFGVTQKSKLMKLEVSGNPLYFHGTGYLILNDLRWSEISLCNDDNDLMYIGVGFETLKPNDEYIFKWGENGTFTSPSHDIFIVSEGSMINRYV